MAMLSNTFLSLPPLKLFFTQQPQQRFKVCACSIKKTQPSYGEDKFERDHGLQTPEERDRLRPICEAYHKEMRLKEIREKIKFARDHGLQTPEERERTRPIWEAYQKEMEEKLRPIREAYEKEIEESDGFDVGFYPALEEFDACFNPFIPIPVCGIIRPMNLNKDVLAVRFNAVAKSAIELYNNKMGSNFKFVEIEKANIASALAYVAFTYYITFTSVEENDEPKVFQAIVQPQSVKGRPHVFLCRQKGNSLEVYENDNYDNYERGRFGMKGPLWNEAEQKAAPLE